MERKIVQLEIEKEALKKEEDTASQERLAQIEKEMRQFEGNFEPDHEGPLGERKRRPFRKSREIKEHIEQLKSSRKMPNGKGI